MSHGGLLQLSGPTGFFSFAQERYRILLRRREGKPAPWTMDPVLRTYRFCNVFREDDITTQWFRDNVRNRLSRNYQDTPTYANEMRLVMAVISFRWFNRIETGRAMLNASLFEQWDSDVAERVLGDLQPLVTGAYMIKSPPGLTKLTGICQCIDRIQDSYYTTINKVHAQSNTMFAHHRALMQFPYLGSFMAYEVVTDLAETWFGDGWSDKMTWAVPGPGAARGLGWVTSDSPTVFRYTNKGDAESMLQLMRELLERSTNGNMWPSAWPSWDMRTVEHTLCEYDKWRRAHAGQNLKRRYRCSS